MKKVLSIFMGLFALLNAHGQSKTEIVAEINPIYQFKVQDLYGDEFDFASLKGKKILIVNTASKCGLTGQYEGLQSLYQSYKDSGLVVVGFPANNFLRQEPGSDAEIASFCEANYGVSFPMMSKISVKGDDIHEVYKYLTTASLNGLKDSKVSWNFQKFLINEEGFLEKVVSPKTKPLSEDILNWLGAN